MYDNQILNQIRLYKDHPTFLPYIGASYSSVQKKIFIIGESHYLPEEYDGKITADVWYNQPKKIYDLISKDAVEWINTRGVIQFFSGPEKLARGHRIFQNLHNAYKEIHKSSHLFKNAIYFNYFQRPAEKQGGSIRIHKMDSEMALRNLRGLNSILQPDLIIFTSSKAYKDFNRTADKEIRNELPQVENVPHPACAWWNKSSRNYGFNQDGSVSTGKQKFQRIITN